MNNNVLHVLLLVVTCWSSLLRAEVAPPFTLPGQADRIALEDYRGKVVYLDFWAAWCTPCRRSFPWMNDVHERLANKGLAIIAINLDDSREAAERFLTATQPTFHIAWDPTGQVAERYELPGMPSSYLIDREGRLVYRHTGFRAADRQRIEGRILDELRATP